MVIGIDSSSYGFLGLGEKCKNLENFEKIDFEGKKVKKISISEKHGLALTGINSLSKHR